MKSSPSDSKKDSKTPSPQEGKGNEGKGNEGKGNGVADTSRNSPGHGARQSDQGGQRSKSASDRSKADAKSAGGAKKNGTA